MTIHDFCTVDCGRDSVNCRADDSSDIASIPIYLHLLPQLQSARPNVLDAVFLQEHPILREKFFRKNLYFSNPCLIKMVYISLSSISLINPQRFRWLVLARSTNGIGTLTESLTSAILSFFVADSNVCAATHFWLCRACPWMNKCRAVRWHSRHKLSALPACVHDACTKQPRDSHKKDLPTFPDRLCRHRHRHWHRSGSLHLLGLKRWKSLFLLMVHLLLPRWKGSHRACYFQRRRHPSQLSPPAAYWWRCRECWPASAARVSTCVRMTVSPYVSSIAGSSSSCSSRVNSKDDSSKEVEPQDTGCWPAGLGLPSLVKSSSESGLILSRTSLASRWTGLFQRVHDIGRYSTLCSPLCSSAVKLISILKTTQLLSGRSAMLASCPRGHHWHVQHFLVILCNAFSHAQ